MQLVHSAESDPGVRHWLRWTSNPLRRISGDRVHLSERLAATGEGHAEPVSLRATPVVELAIELAASGIRFAISKRSSWARAAVPQPKRSSASSPNYGNRICSLPTFGRRLRQKARPGMYRKACLYSGCRPVREPSERPPRSCAAWDRAPAAASTGAFRTILEWAGLPEDGSKECPIQVDLALKVEGPLSSEIAATAATAAELLLRISPVPRGPGSVAAYRNAFLARYGHERQVPLLELLDPDLGLGPQSGYGHGATGPDAAKAAARSQTLMNLACAALRNRAESVTLTDDHVGQLQTWSPDSRTAPVSLDINVLIGARSVESMEAGDYTLTLGPNLGAWAAGRNFGRFAHLHSEGKELLSRAARREESIGNSDQIWAEVVYLPSHVRSANVAIRPAIRSHEIVFGVSPGVPDSHVIPAGELVVGVEGERFYVQWPAAGKRVRFVSGHMLNHRSAPVAAQFLLEVAHDGEALFNSFDWGPAESLPCLPRVQYGRIVLRTAEWKLRRDPGTKATQEGLRQWRATWGVPRYVCLTFGDNRLVLDLELEDHAAQVLTEWSKLPENGALVIQEVFPALDQAWVTGDEGHYYAEFVIPLVLGPASRVASPELKASKPRTTPVPAIPVALIDAPVRVDCDRQCPPGSNWLYFKLYGPAARQDDLIGHRLAEFADNAVAAGLADSWFFIRYADPEHHLRLRFHGDPDQLAYSLFGQVCAWANQLISDGICTRLAVDTYDREIERFGGAAGMLLSERLFYEDSRAAARLGALLAGKHWKEPSNRRVMLAFLVDDLLQSLGMDEVERSSWYADRSPSSRDSGAVFRDLKNSLRNALGNSSGWLASVPDGRAVEALLQERHDRCRPLARELRALETAGALGQSASNICTSYVHLHLNRLGAATEESLLLGLLFRSRQSLAKAPLAVSTAP